ncbi:MAG: hypothetical protein JWR38_133 [Mucilaginibacter sp.]|nr:hypothetical protein [Mucilaginibacter sp.]
MKKIFKLISVFVLLTVILLLAIAASRKESPIEPNISGKWINKIENSQLRQQYEFKSNHTFEYSLVSINATSNKIIGISSKIIGKYQVKDTQLNLYDLVNYANKNQRLGPVSELVTTDGAKTANNTIALDDKKNTLSVFLKCPPNADCFPSPSVYYKQ